MREPVFQATVLRKKPNLEQPYTLQRLRHTRPILLSQAYETGMRMRAFLICEESKSRRSWQVMVGVTAARLWMSRLLGKSKKGTISVGKKNEMGKSRSTA